MPASMNLKGIDNLHRKLQAMGRKGAIAENKALREGGDVIADTMRQNVGYSDDPPHIRDNIEISRVKTDQLGYKHIEIGPAGNAQDGLFFYARFLEFGTSRNPGGHPFVEPSLEESHAEVVEKAKDILRDIL